MARSEPPDEILRKAHRQLFRLSPDETADASLDTSLLAAALDSSVCGITIADLRHPDAPLVYVNDALLRITGYQRDELVGRNCRILQGEHREQDGVHTMRAAIAAGESATVQVLNLRKDGCAFYNRLHLAPIRDDDGELTHYVGIQEDVTHEQELQDDLAASDDRLRLMAANCPGVMFQIRVPRGEVGRVAFISDGIARFTGVSAAELVDGRTPLIELFHPDDRSQLDAALRAPSDHLEVQEHECRLLHRDDPGRATWVEIHAAPRDTQNGELEWFGQMIDITRRKQAETDLGRAREEAEQASSVKSRFLAKMTHEVRTPLNAIMGVASLLRDTRLTGEQEHYLDIFETASGNLMDLVDSVLDLARMEEGNFALAAKEFAPAELVEEQLDLLASRAHQKGLEILWELGDDVPRRVRGDETRLRQIVTNLVGNAVKFTESGTVTVSLEAARAVGAPVELQLRVEDTGVGIESGKLDLMFQAFVQGDDGMTRRYGGSGLGLAICKQLADLMGGRLTGDSEPEQGSVFRLAVPVDAIRDDQLEEVERFSLPEGRGHRALVIEPCAPSRLSASRYLRRAGFVVHAVEGLDAAWRRARSPRMNETATVLAAWDGDDRLLAGYRRLARQLDAVLLVSGKQPRTASRVNRAHERFLLKPLRPAVVHAELERLFADAPATPSRQTPTPDSSKGRRSELKVLLVEDEPTNALLMRKFLERWQANVVHVSDGAKAVDAFQTDAFDLILMDIQMPVMDGWTAIQRIRELEAGGQERTALVALSANTYKEDREYGLSLGCDDYLGKPVSRDTLAETLSRLELI